MSQTIAKYFAELSSKYSTGQAREHAYRPVFESLIKALDPKLKILNDPSRSEHGNPDFVFLRGDITIGYVETKDIGVDLDKTEKTNQMERYLGYSNLILTDYLEFRFFRNGARYGEAIKIGKIKGGGLEQNTEGRDIPNEKRSVFVHQKTNSYASATGFISSIFDLAKFISTIQADFSKKDKGFFQNKKSIIQMTHPYQKTGKDESYGLGLQMVKISGRKIIGHGGGFQGFTTRVIFDSKNNIGVVVLSNMLGSSAGGIAEGILEIIYDFVDHQNEYGESRKQPLGKYEGHYRNTWGDDIVSKFVDTLIAFSPEASYPSRNRVILKKASGKDSFTLKSKHGFGLQGEPVRFFDFKKGKSQKVLFGPNPSIRVKI